MRKDVKPLPSFERLHRLLFYDAQDGRLSWAVTHKCVKWGDEAGAWNGKYRRVIIDGNSYYVTRVIWKMMTREEPPEFVDHIDGDYANYRWANLRAATNGQNIQNSKIRKDNKSGVKGVCWDPVRQRWVAQIAAGGKLRRVGRFSSIEEAEIAVRAAREKLHGEFARHV